MTGLIWGLVGGAVAANVIAMAVGNIRKWRAEEDLIRGRHRVYGQEAAKVEVVRAQGRDRLANVRGAMRALAKKMGGEFHEVGMFGMPKVSVPVRMHRALVTVYGAGAGRREFYTQFTCPLPKAWTHRIEVYCQLLSDEEIRLRGVEDIKIGDPVFDPRYVVKADSFESARRFLSEDVRAEIGMIRDMEGSDYVLVSVNRERLMVRKTPMLETAESLELFVGLCRGLAVRIITGEGEDVRLIPVCQVCGVDVSPGEQAAVCHRCRSPHHIECWTVNGCCAVPACGEAVYVRN